MSHQTNNAAASKTAIARASVGTEIVDVVIAGGTAGTGVTATVGVADALGSGLSVFVGSGDAVSAGVGSSVAELVGVGVAVAVSEGLGVGPVGSAGSSGALDSAGVLTPWGRWATVAGVAAPATQKISTLRTAAAVAQRRVLPALASRMEPAPLLRVVVIAAVWAYALLATRNSTVDPVIVAVPILPRSHPKGMMCVHYRDRLTPGIAIDHPSRAGEWRDHD